MRHIILFGALHCANEPNWLFEYLSGQVPFPPKNPDVKRAGAGRTSKWTGGSLRVLFGQDRNREKNFVIPDTSALHPRIFELFQLLKRQILENFCTLIVFRI